MPAPPTQAVILAMFKGFVKKKKLLEIKKEVEETTTVVNVKRKGVEREETKRGRSEIVIDGIHKVLGRNHLNCHNAEGPCLNALIEHFVEAEIAEEVVECISKLLPVLYTKSSVLNTWMSTISVTIQKKFHTDEELGDEIIQTAKEKLRLSKEERKLQQINYAAKVAKANAQQKELTDTKVLEVINALRTAIAEDQKDLISKICLVGLCVGSRISEIVRVSTYTEADNPHYVQVEGVSKERKKVDENKEPGVAPAPPDVCQTYHSLA